MSAPIVRLLALGLACLAIPALAGSEPPLQPDPGSGAQPPGAVDMVVFARGAKAWAENCSRCHRLRDPKEMSDAQWAVTMAHMRVRAGLDGRTAADIRLFLQQSNRPAAGAVQPMSLVEANPGAGLDHANSEALYRQTCIACHGADARGALPGVPDFTADGGRLAKPDEVLAP